MYQNAESNKYYLLFWQILIYSQNPVYFLCFQISDKKSPSKCCHIDCIHVLRKFRCKRLIESAAAYVVFSVWPILLIAEQILFFFHTL